MDIPYRKTLIYILTFAACSYTGVGTSLLRNLKDAVLSAESVFGDIFRNAITVTDKFRSLHKVFDVAVEECIYACPEGQSPIPTHEMRALISPGCSSLGFQIYSEYLPLEHTNECCNMHAMCYNTCKSGKETCDLEFKKCLHSYCESYKSAGDTIAKGCEGAAKVLFTDTLLFGCKSYLDAQEHACYCPPANTENKQQVEENSDLLLRKFRPDPGVIDDNDD